MTMVMCDVVIVAVFPILPHGGTRGVVIMRIVGIL